MRAWAVSLHRMLWALVLSVACGTTTAMAAPLPIVSMTSPANGATYTAPASITVSASAMGGDDGYYITSIKVYRGATLVVTLNQDSISYTDTGVGVGTYGYRVVATDNVGGTKSSPTSTVTVTSPANQAPTVQLTAPTSGATFIAGDLVSVAATAADTDGSISRVDFFRNGTAFSSDTVAPYSATWDTTSLAAGSYSLVARATDNGGKTTDSAASTVTVNANVAPTVTLTSPQNNANYTTPATVSLTATAADSDGSVVEVRFYGDGTLLATDTVAPYAATWTNVPVGGRLVEAVAKDNRGALKTATANIQVGVTGSIAANPNPCTLYETWQTMCLSTVSWNTPDPAATVWESYEEYDAARQEDIQHDDQVGSGTSGSTQFQIRSTQRFHRFDLKIGTTLVAQTLPGQQRAPTTAITAPSNNQVVSAPGSLTIAASAADQDGIVSKVEFFNGPTLLATDATVPYSYAWSNIPAGTYTLTTKAYDNLSAQKTSAPVTLIVNTLPTVALTAPADGSVVAAPATITVSANATDSDGSISRVDFYNGSTLLATDTTAPYTTSWSNIAAGVYTLTAKTYDDRSAERTSAPVTLTVNGLPTVALTAPINNQMIPAPGNLTLTATATDQDGTISSVEFYNGTTLLATDTTAPYSYTWNNIAAGTYTLTTKAYDNRSTQSTSAPVTLIVNTMPTVTLTAPVDGTVTDAPATLSVSANAADSDGGISRVEFYQAGTLIGQDTSAPYSVAWTNVAAGTYVVSAKAIDNRDAVVTSSNATVLVRSLALPASQTRSYVYDEYQRLCKVIEPETGATVMAYDSASNLLWSAAGLPSATSCGSSDPSVTSRQVHRGYDVRNRLQALSFPDSNGNQTWNYTADGLPSQIVTYNDTGASSVTNAYSYNNRRLPTGESLSQAGRTTWSIGYGYNPNGHLTQHAYPDGLTIDYAPNALGQPTQAGAYATGVSYYPNGAIGQFTYGNGLVHSSQQNARGLPERSHDVYGATSVLDDSYDFDQNGNVAAISDGLPGNRGNRDMIYDAVDRLVSVSSPMFGVDPLVMYEYDELDNLKRVKANGSDRTYVYDASNRLTNVTNTIGGASVVGLGYDVQGNLANKNGVTHAFDYGNRLRAVFAKEEYGYDGYGRRILAAHFIKGDIWSQYGQDGALRFQEDQRRGKFLSYIYLGGSLVAQREGATFGGAFTVTYQHTDALGSPAALTDTGRNVVERSEYAPYGSLLNRPIKDGPGYTGHIMDAATGLAYMQQRYYDPVIGRFLSVDPVTADGNTGSNFNRYWYANNNPYLFTDPDGRQARPGDRGAQYIGASISGTDVKSAESIGMANIPNSWNKPLGTVNVGAPTVDADDFHNTPARPYVGSPDGGLEAVYPEAWLLGGFELAAYRSLPALRLAYLEGVGGITTLAAELRAAGVGAEAVARVVVPMRNMLKDQIRRTGPITVRMGAELRNMFRYGNRLGPTAEQQLGRYGSWERVLERTGSTNPLADKAAGL